MIEDARFRKIKHSPKDGLTEISYEVPVMGGHDDHTVTTGQAPHPDFLKALQGLAPTVIEVAELKGVAKPTDVEVRGVSISYNKNESVGCIITAMRQLKRSGPMLINTPTKLLEAGEGASADSLLPESAVGIIDALFGETRLFLTGKRAQLEMDLKGQAGTPASVQPDDGSYPIEADSLKAALILSGLVGKPGPEAFDKLDKAFPEYQKVVYLGRAPIALLVDMTTARRAEVFAIAIDVLLGGSMETGDGEILDRLATEVASHGGTLAPFFELFPFAPSEDPGDEFLPVPALEEQWTAITRGQLLGLVRRQMIEIAASACRELLHDRVAQYVMPIDFLALDLDKLDMITAFASAPVTDPPAEFVALKGLWEARAEPNAEPKEENEDTGEIAKPDEEPTDPAILESLAGVSNWLDYKQHCVRFGIRCTKANWTELEKSRVSDVSRPGYRDPQLQEEVAERRRSAQTQTAAAKSKLPAVNDDLLGP